MLCTSRSHEDPAVEKATRDLQRMAHKSRTEWLRSNYHNEEVREAAYAAFAKAAAKAARKPEFGYLGYETLVAKYGEERARELLAKARQAKRDRYGAEGVSDIGRQAHAASAANDPFGAAGLSRKAGTAAAKRQGKRVGYAGVRWQRRQTKTKAGTQDADGFWRCAFSHRGKRYSVGSGYATEEKAARAHDRFVLEHNLDRQLHFPHQASLEMELALDEGNVGRAQRP